MAVHLVTYDLKKSGQNYDGLITKIKSYNWARIAASAYAVSTTATAYDVMESLKPYIDSNDLMFVSRLTGQWSGWNLPKDVVDWLNRQQF